MSMTDDMLFIKNFHRRRAQTALQRDYVAMMAARDAEIRAQHARDAFHARAAQQELAMFAALCERQVHVRDILDANQDVAALRAQQRDYADAVTRADTAHQKARETRAASAERLRHAERIVTKFDELVRREHDQRARDAERREELELEDVAHRVVGADADDSAESGRV